jgi:hypothetical protein
VTLMGPWTMFVHGGLSLWKHSGDSWCGTAAGYACVETAHTNASLLTCSMLCLRNTPMRRWRSLVEASGMCSLHSSQT